jgi:hypothetical protein
MCDMAHFSGLVAAGLHPNPVEHCDIVTSTTHKTLAGPRSGFVLCRSEHAQAVDRAVFPGMQGGPLVHAIAAKASCFKIAASPASARTRSRCARNADALSDELIANGSDVVTGGTDTHLLQLDLRRSGLDREGRGGAAARGQADGQPQHGAVRRAAADGRVRRPDRHAGGDDAGLRRGRLPRGRPGDRRRARRREPRRAARRSEALCSKRPLYPGFRGYTTYA